MNVSKSEVMCFILSNHIYYVKVLFSCVQGCTRVYMGVHGCKQYLIQTGRLLKCWIQKRDTCQSQSILSNQMSKLNDLCFNQRFSEVCSTWAKPVSMDWRFDEPKELTDWRIRLKRRIHTVYPRVELCLNIRTTCLSDLFTTGPWTWLNIKQEVFKVLYSMFYFLAYELSKAVPKSYPFVRSSSSVHIWLYWLTIVRFSPRGGRSVFITALLSPRLKNCNHGPWEKMDHGLSFESVHEMSGRGKNLGLLFTLTSIFVGRGPELTRVSKWC